MSDTADRPQRRRGLAWRLLGAGGGLAIMAIGAGFLVGALGFRLGTLRSMGPGYVPLSLGVLCLLLGLAIALQDFLRAYLPETPHWRPFVVTSLSVLVFAAAIGRLGMVPAVFLTVVVAAQAEPKPRWLPTLALAAAISALAWAIFILGLGMTVPAWRLRL